MQKIKIAFCLLFFVTALNAAEAFAACITSHAFILNGRVSIEQEFATSKYIVVAKAISEMEVGSSADGQFLQGTNYKIQVDQTIKGPNHRFLTLFSENSSGRFPLEHGKPYLLFISDSMGRLGVDYCGNSGLLKDSAEILAITKELARANP